MRYKPPLIRAPVTAQIIRTFRATTIAAPSEWHHSCSLRFRQGSEAPSSHTAISWATYQAWKERSDGDGTDRLRRDDPRRGHFLIEDGLFAITRIYLPRTIVERVAADGVHLAVTEREATALARESPPSDGDAWYGPRTSGMAVVGVRLLEIPLREQTVVTRMVPIVIREVHLRKGIARSIERVAVTLRREEAHVESDVDERVHIAEKATI